jgi:bifunctional non-homologous end joining protein LigD
MKNESVVLYCQEGSSDKEYHAELKQEGEGWIVNFAYGKRGGPLKIGCKTCDPLPYEKAKKSYDSLVKSKRGKGYKPNEGETSTINTVGDEKIDSRIRPQLLNELTEEEAIKFIHDDSYCMQEKYDGERRMISIMPDGINGVNKKGFVIPLRSEIEKECMEFGQSHILDGEDMGGKVMIFDDIYNIGKSYFSRYNLLSNVIVNFSHLELVKTAWDTNTKKIMYARLKNERAEGVVFKNINATYSAGRPASGGDQFKCKFYETASCVVESVSSVKSSIGLEVYDELGECVSVGNATVYANSPKLYVGDVVEVKYLYYNEGGSLYQPILLKVRDDVDMAECTLAKLKRKKDVE